MVPNPSPYGRQDCQGVVNFCKTENSIYVELDLWRLEKGSSEEDGTGF